MTSERQKILKRMETVKEKHEYPTPEFRNDTCNHNWINTVALHFYCSNCQAVMPLYVLRSGGWL